MIELKNISFSYSNQEHGGLKNVDLAVRDGECILLCGRSGCGKTTITRLVNGLIPKFYSGDLSGKVLINGQDIADLPMYDLAGHIGSVFQNPRTQFFNVDSDSEIAFGLENEGRPPEELRKRVETTAKDLDIQKLRGRSLHELSGGEKQKIAFASVYAMNPDIYLLDELSSNLDMDAIESLKRHLKSIKEQGKTILIAEHRLYYLMDLADRIVYLEQGEIAAIYTPEQFKGISEEERMRMGLRAIDLRMVHPSFSSRRQDRPRWTMKNVSMSYRKCPVLENVNLDVSAGEVIGIIGHNGAGKTTFSRTLCGLHKEYTGQFLRNERIQNGKARLKYSYMVMQDVNFELFADSVEAECSFGIRNPDLAFVQSTMDKLGLLPYGKQHPNTLSGGQKQRVAVAVSMICGKEVLVFDEPTSGLDFDSMAQVAELIQELAAMGKVIFIVTHDYEFACRTCSRVLHIDQGKLCDDLQVSEAAEERIRELFSIAGTHEDLLAKNGKRAATWNAEQELSG